ARELPGIRFYAVTFTPAAGAKLAGQACRGVFMVVTDRDRLRPVRIGLEVAAALSRLYGQQFRLEDAATLFGSKAVLARIRAGGGGAGAGSGRLGGPPGTAGARPAENPFCPGGAPLRGCHAWTVFPPLHACNYMHVATPNVRDGSVEKLCIPHS